MLNLHISISKYNPIANSTVLQIFKLTTEIWEISNLQQGKMSSPCLGHQTFTKLS